MSIAPTPEGLDHLVGRFAEAWLSLGEPGVGERLVADPILVLGPEGTVPVTRAGFLAAVAGRQAAVSSATDTSTALVGTVTQPLGERMVLATITWSFGHGEAAPALVGDFLLQREGTDGLRCVAYLPRTNVLDHVPGA